tara:strand:- start:805 stop:1119 length:315 start_codon:yes stop_codon:yes gene_type:complete
MKKIQPKELKKRIDSKEKFVLLDVRESHEVAYAKIDPHVHISVGALLEQQDELDKSTPIIVMCHTGVRSAHACQYLEPLGYDVTNLEGGIEAWSQLVDPSVPRY